MVDFGKAIRLVRHLRGLSQEQLRVMIQFSPSYVSLVESGKRTPTLQALEKVCKALNLPLWKLTLLASSEKEAELEQISTVIGEIMLSSKKPRSRRLSSG